MNFINIIICAYNEEESIERCIDSVSKAIGYCKRTDKNFNVYIIDNESTDRTNELAANKIEELDCFSLLKIKHSSLSVSRNKYRETENSQYVAYIDADGAIEKNWLDKVFQYIDNNDVHAFGGRVKDINGSGNLVYEVFYDQDSVGEYIMGANMIINRDVLDEVGGFPELFYSRGDETGMLYAINAHKGKIDLGYDRSIVAYNAFDNSLINYLKCLVMDSQRHFLLDCRYKKKKVIVAKVLYKCIYLIPFLILLIDINLWIYSTILPTVLACLRKPKVILRQMLVLSKSTAPVYKKIQFGSVVLFSELIVSIAYLKSIFKKKKML